MRKKDSQNKQLKNALVLTGVAFQMGATVYLFVLLGKWLDNSFNQGNKLFIIICTLLGVSISLYLVVQQLKKLNQ